MKQKQKEQEAQANSLAESKGAVAATSTNNDSAGAGLADSVITEFMKVAGSMPDVKCCLLDPSGIDTAESTLEVTPATCSIMQLCPMDVVRLLVCSTSGLCQFQVMYPVPHCVDHLKCKSTYS